MHQSPQESHRLLIRVLRTRCGCSRGMFIKDFTQDEVSVPEIKIPLPNKMYWLDDPNHYGCNCELETPVRVFKFVKSRQAASRPNHFVLVEEYMEA